MARDRKNRYRHFCLRSQSRSKRCSQGQRGEELVLPGSWIAIAKFDDSFASSRTYRQKLATLDPGVRRHYLRSAAWILGRDSQVKSSTYYQGPNACQWHLRATCRATGRCFLVSESGSQGGEKVNPSSGNVLRAAWTKIEAIAGCCKRYTLSA